MHLIFDACDIRLVNALVAEKFIVGGVVSDIQILGVLGAVLLSDTVLGADGFRLLLLVGGTMLLLKGGILIEKSC